MSLRHKFKKVIVYGGMTVATYFTVTDLFFEIKMVNGISMQPTLNTSGKGSDLVLMSKLEPFHRGDVVTLVNPKDPSETLIKRLIAFENDRVTYGKYDEVKDIPKGHVWVEGDNQNRNTNPNKPYCNSLDSNVFGPVPAGLIKAKAIRVVYPKWRRIERIEQTDRVIKAEDVPKENRDESECDEKFDIHLSCEDCDDAS